jgi:hypothetical protein
VSGGVTTSAKIEVLNYNDHHNKEHSPNVAKQMCKKLALFSV